MKEEDSMSNKQHLPIERKATAALMLLALSFTVSSLPGIGSFETSELSSVSNQIRSCDIEGQIKADGTASCNAISSGSNKFEGHVEIQKVVATEGTEASYTVTGEFSIKCTSCDEGVRSAPLDLTASTLAEARQYLNEQAARLKEENDRAEKVALCKIDPETEETFTTSEQLECHIDKMATMEEKAARRYYEKHIKGKLSELAQSGNAQDAQLAAHLAGKLHENMGVDCQKTMMQQMQAAQMTANAPFNPFAGGQGASIQSTPTDYIRDSSCDIKAMGNYNATLLALGAQLKGPNAQAAAAKIQGLQQQWGTYFDSRGMVLNNPTMMQINTDAGVLMTQINDFQKTLADNYAKIQERHANLLQGNQTDGTAPKLNTGDGRLLRGGLQYDTGVNPTGTIDTGNNNGAVLPMPGAVNQQKLGTQAPAVLAPRMGSPVGS
jgi:hypothetical protein